MTTTHPPILVGTADVTIIPKSQRNAMKFIDTEALVNEIMSLIHA